MSEKKWVEIDYCPECRGIWLDKGELEKLIEKENQIHETYEKQYSQDSQYSDKWDYRKKKKSSIFWEITDMFDF